HPYATAGAAVGIGILIIGLFKMMNRSGSAGGRYAGAREHSSRSGMNMEILSMIMPIVMPYITQHLEKYLGSMHSKDRN
ncbi:MAG: hypothetical protein PHT99_08290, partial [Methanoregula sp.]|nr:hypothetical protein [Methanoregula sp.]